jgi:hypothetical protein
MEHLVGRIELLFDDTTFDISLPKNCIEIASDGGHEKQTGTSTFGWVVAINK